MSAEGSAAGSWPLGQALRAYFLAFLPPEQVDEAVRQVGREAVGKGATGILAVFAIASEVLHAQVRLTPEVEALVLVDESRLRPDEAAMVLGLNAEQVEATLAEAHGLLDAAPVGVPEPGVAEELAEPEPAELEPAELEPAEAELAEAELAELRAAELQLVEDEPVPGAQADAEQAATPTEESEPVRRSGLSRRAAASGPASGLRGRAPVLVGVALAAMMAGGVLVTAGQTAERNAADPEPSATESAPAPSPSATPTAPGIPGLFDLRNAVLTEAVTDGRPGSAETAFSPSQDANLWMAYAYLGSTGTDRLGVLWYRGEEVVFRDIFPLDQENGQRVSTLAAAAKGNPGRYRADIFVNDQVVATVAFEVR